MKRLNAVLLLIGLLLLAHSDPSPSVLAQAEPRFSYPGARRFRLTSYFDHSNPNYTVDGVLTIYTKEIGRQEHGCADCYWSGGTQVCGYHTETNCGGRRIYYDGHPAIDYAFPLNTPIAAAAPGTAYRRTILGSAVVIDHGGGYWSKYGHVDPSSRIADGTQVERGQQIALSSNTGTGAAHLHFEVRHLGEYGDVVDPYGWWGEWYEDPWNRPWGHTHDWWRSRDPIPMGYRDQNGITYGPFQLTGAIRDKWEALDGEPGSPLEDRHWCSPYGECQSFEKGYIRWDYSTTTYYAYTETLVPRVFYIAGANWNTTLSIRNRGSTSSQVSVIFIENNHVVDSRTYRTLPSDATWVVDTQQVLQELADRFTGVAAVYANQPITILVTHQPPLHDAFLPLVLNNH
ncbi:MAG TPA: M23 family metallopeptidase [Chloroflexi bacterium]|nr:M23 family metallopeptidase [Chloroflexota bacterium]